MVSAQPPEGETAVPAKRVVEVTPDLPGVTINFYIECKIDETIADWKFVGTCPAGNDTQAGATDVDAKPPSGSSISIAPGEGGADPWPLPVKDESHPDLLYEPVELPDLDLPGGVHEVECTLDDSGVAAGQASSSLDPSQGSPMIYLCPRTERGRGVAAIAIQRLLDRCLGCDL